MEVIGNLVSDDFMKPAEFKRNLIGAGFGSINKRGIISVSPAQISRAGL